MTPTDLRMDHIAVAVRSVEAAADRLKALLGYERATTAVVNSRQRVNVLMLHKDGSLPIKLISPSDAESPLWEFVRKGGGLHHVCFRASDVAEACATLAAGGARILTPPEPGEAFDDHMIAFLYLGLGMNVEVIDTDARRGRLEGQP